MKKKYLFVSLLAVVMLAGVAWAWSVLQTIDVSDQNTFDEVTVPLGPSTIYQYAVQSHGTANRTVHVIIKRNSDSWTIFNEDVTTDGNAVSPMVEVPGDWEGGSYTYEVIYTDPNPGFLHVDLNKQ